MIDSIENKRQINDPYGEKDGEKDVLSIKRMRTPSSLRLKENILNLTEELPQYTSKPIGAEVYNISSFFSKVGINKPSYWNGLKPYIATVAAGFAVIAISSNFWLPTQNDVTLVDSFAYETLTVEQLEKEIEWQDLMLLQDELAFAGLM